MVVFIVMLRAGRDSLKNYIRFFINFPSDFALVKL